MVTKDMMEKDVTNPIINLLHTWPKIFKGIHTNIEENRKVCRDIINTLDAGDEKISAIFITIQFGYVCTEILNHYQVPIIAISPPGLAPHLARILGNPDNPADRPDAFVPMVEPLSFTQRLVSTLIYILLDSEINILTYWAFQSFVVDLPIYDNILRNRVDLLLLASHHVTHSPSVLAPNTLEIGGIHCREGRPLPLHLQQIMDSHPEGVVYVSFGSSVKPSQMGEERMKVFLETFSQLSYTVIWKWDGEEMSDLPSNVILQTWVPQQDLLAHPHLKVFVTHGGLLSLQETLYHSTPIVGIPLGNDQKPNMMRAEIRGYAVMLDWPSLNTENFVAAINKAATDPEIAASMERAHAMFVDSAESPQARAVWWVEYAVRNGGAQFLRPVSATMPWYQYHLLDVFLFTATLLLSIITTLSFCCFKCFRCLSVRRASKHKKD